MSRKTILEHAALVHAEIINSLGTLGSPEECQVLSTVMVAQSIDRLTELLRPTITEINALIERAKAEEAAAKKGR